MAHRKKKCVDALPADRQVLLDWESGTGNFCVLGKLPPGLRYVRQQLPSPAISARPKAMFPEVRKGKPSLRDPNPEEVVLANI